MLTSRQLLQNNLLTSNEMCLPPTCNISECPVQIWFHVPDCTVQVGLPSFHTQSMGKASNPFVGRLEQAQLWQYKKELGQ